MRNIKITYSLAILLFLSYLSCMGLSGRVRPARDTRIAAEVRFDPLGFPGDDSVITGHGGMKSRAATAVDNQEQAQSDSAVYAGSNSAEERTIFRVQVYSTKSYDDAQQYALSIKALFPEGVTVEYHVPYYKVQVGQFSNSSDGQLFLEKVKQLGFENAWLTRVIK
jgi:hypothetical protein